jgi:hypothetical protein
MTSIKVDSFSDDLLRALPHLESTTECIQAYFKRLLNVKYVGMLFKNVGSKSNTLTTFKKSANHTSNRSPGLKFQRLTTFGAEPEKATERVVISLDSCGLAAKCYLSKQVHIVNNMFLPDDESESSDAKQSFTNDTAATGGKSPPTPLSTNIAETAGVSAPTGRAARVRRLSQRGKKLVHLDDTKTAPSSSPSNDIDKSKSFIDFFIGTTDVRNVVHIPLLDVNNDGECFGVLALYDYVNGNKFEYDTFNTSSLNDDILSASFSLSNALISDQRNLQLHKAKRAREFQRSVEAELLCVDNIATLANKFALTLRCDAVWVYLIQRNYNFRGTNQMELKRQKEAHIKVNDIESNNSSRLDSKKSLDTLYRQASYDVSDDQNNDYDEIDDQSIQMPSSSLSRISHAVAHRARRHSLEVNSVVVQCVKSKEVIIVNDARTNPSCHHELDMFEKDKHILHMESDEEVVVSGQISRVHLNDQEEEVSLICIPIISKEINKGVIGVIELFQKGNILLNDDDVELATLFSLQISGTPSLPFLSFFIFSSIFF